MSKTRKVGDAKRFGELGDGDKFYVRSGCAFFKKDKRTATMEHGGHKIKVFAANELVYVMCAQVRS